MADCTTARTRGLARKLTCSVVSFVVAGACLILLIQVSLTLTSVDEWGGGTKTRMIELEQENLLKLAEAKAEFVSEHFGRVRESIFQLRAFAGEAIVQDQDTMVLDSYLASFSGVQQSETSVEHSSWFIPGFTETEVPEAGSSLESLLNRSSLMDVPFRAMQRQHPLVYLAALDDPSPAEGVVSDINMQTYAAFDMTSYLDYGLSNECDVRYDVGLTVEFYEPRCRLWYQDAVEAGNTGVIITNPYEDADSEKLTLSAAAPVLNSTDGTVLGVVGLDIDSEDIESCIKNLTVIGDHGYAYLLAPGGEGQVAVHTNLDDYGREQYIVDLEEGFEDSSEEERGAFEDLVTRISNGAECEGSAEYSKGGDTWILAWKHETVSGADASGNDDCGDGGFIAVVTVSETVLLEAFSETNSEISRVVAFASLMMALVLLAIGCATGFIARVVAGGIVAPINQLIDVVHALNRMDFSRQGAGTWIVNEISSPEVEELMKAFEAMTTVVKFANTTLATGDIASAKLIYVEALILFTKLGNDRGVAIVNNNLGNVHTLQAGQLVARVAAVKGNNSQAKQLMQEAQRWYTDAETNYTLAIEDAEMLCATASQQGGNGGSPLHLARGGGETKVEERAPSHMSVKKFAPHQIGDVEAGIPAATDVGGNDDNKPSQAALYRQLATRKFNLALCLAAKGRSAVSARGQPDANAINEARRLINECIQLTSPPPSAYLDSRSKDSNNNAKNDLRRFGFLLELSALEREQQGRSREAGEALDTAEGVIALYTSVDPNGGPAAVSAAAATAASLETPVQILQQRLLEARAAHCVAAGYPEQAIVHYTQAMIGTGNKMDPDVARSSLVGLRGLLSSASSSYGRDFSSELLVALGLPPGAGKDAASLTSAIDDALVRVERMGATVARSPSGTEDKTTVDLCFVMDCTGSMQRWINQAKSRLQNIIAQAKGDGQNVSLRVAFVGYRDFGDKVQYEKFDFHAEKEVSNLLEKLDKIKAYGGSDFPEDVAGGLKLATGLNWRSKVRLCILIADAPCHGSSYHSGMEDRYPKGCPNGHDPSKLLYELQHKISADFYFIRATQFTDKMIDVLQSKVSDLWKQDATRQRSTQHGVQKGDIVVHNLESGDNRFLEVVVESVSESIKHYKQYMDEY